MKFFTPLIFAFLLIAFDSQGQSVPQGMKYQAVARDLKGQVMANQFIQLKISLYSDPIKRDVAYIEIHKVNTNDLGLFSLSVGEGITFKGSFESIPWSSEDVWMEVAVQTDDETDFITISDSRMLSVPYAFHAATANEIIGNGGDRSPGDPYTKIWNLTGNTNTNPARDKLGTNDLADLVIVTNDIERMRVLQSGDINMVNSLTVGRDLNTRKNVYLNTDTLVNPHNAAWYQGHTFNYGNFTVERMSSTLLTGTLTVNLHTELNSSLNVDGLARVSNLTQSTIPSNGALVVAGGTGIGRNLNVGGATALLSTLDVTGATKLLSSLDVSGLSVFLNTTQSTTKDNGAVILEGGLGIEKNLNVGGASTFGGAVAFGGAVSITDLTQSTSPTTGALIVAGGAGINKRLNVHEGVLFDSTLGVAGITSITNNTSSTNSSSGALVVTGGAGIGQNINVGGDGLVSGLFGVGGLYTNVKMNIISPAALEFAFNAEITGTTNKMNFNKSGQLYVSSNKSGTSGNTGNFGFYLDGQDQGMVIKLKGSSFPTTANNYMAFWGSGNTVHGAIEGQTLSELYNSFDYIWFQAMSAVDAALGVAMVIVDLIGIDDGDAAIVDGVELVASVAKWTEKSVEFETDIGIAYVSGSADYAEWLRKADTAERYSFGDVVAVKGGNISKITDEADHYMVISMAPIVLGNMPVKGQEAAYEKVAFLGQVPVKVKGVTHIGDYIIPSGLNDGIAIAVSKLDMTIRQFQKVIGVAWSEGYSSTGYTMINVAIGLNQNPLVDKLEQQENEISQLKSSLDEIGQYLASKDPTFRMPDLGDKGRIIDQPALATAMSTITNHEAAMAVPVKSNVNMTSDQFEAQKEIILKDPEALTNILADTRKLLDERGVNYKQFPKLEKMLNDPQYFINSLGKDPSTFRD